MDLEKIGLKVTPQRTKLLECLSELQDQHPSFKELQECIQKSFPTLSKSTLHANLKTLEEKNLILTFNDGHETRYELNLKPHINVIKKNGSIHDVTDVEIEKHLEEMVSFCLKISFLK